MISVASCGDSSPAAQAAMTADDALRASAALSIFGNSNSTVRSRRRHQRAQQGAQHGGIPFESLFDRLGAQSLALAINQRLEGSRNEVSCPLGAAVWISALPGLKRASSLLLRRVFWPKVPKPVLAPGASSTAGGETTPKFVPPLRANLPREASGRCSAAPCAASSIPSSGACGWLRSCRRRRSRVIEDTHALVLQLASKLARCHECAGRSAAR